MNPNVHDSVKYSPVFLWYAQFSLFTQNTQPILVLKEFRISLCLVHTKFVCNASLHVPTQITERVKTGSFDQMFCVIRYQYISKQFSVCQSHLYSVRSPFVSSSDRVKSPVHLVRTTFPNNPSPSAVHWNPFRPSCTSFPLRPILF